MKYLRFSLVTFFLYVHVTFFILLLLVNVRVYVFPRLIYKEKNNDNNNKTNL